MGIPKDKYFVLKDGTVIKSLFELSKALKTMSEDVFRHHVNETRNDFYNWINDVVKDKDLATKVLSAKSNKEIQKFIGERIQKDIEKKIEKKPAMKNIVNKDRIKKVVSKNHIKEIKIKTEKMHELKDRLFGFFKAANVKKTKTAPRGKKFGMQCPYKTWQCGFLEFLFGIIIGLLIAFVLTSIF